MRYTKNFRDLFERRLREREEKLSNNPPHRYFGFESPESIDIKKQGLSLYRRLTVGNFYIVDGHKSRSTGDEILFMV